MPATGLSQAEAKRRLQTEGPNELSPPKRRTPLRIALEVAREPMFQLLLAAGGLYLLLGDRAEAGMLLAFVALTAGITVVQEQRTERALEALRDLTSPRAQVLREGQRQRIAGREVVRGDVLVLTEGDRVAADARVLSAGDLSADESLLTGEAEAVAKHAADRTAAPASAQGLGDPAMVYAGTLLVGGQGLAEVVATGPDSQIGRIGKSLSSIDETETPLRAQTRRLVRQFSVLGVALSAAVVVLYGLTRGDWLAGLLAGITLAMSMLPQEFPLILAVFMAMGAWRLSQQRVLARRSATIETLGSATVLCTDKTGTLTLNRMTVKALSLPVQAEHWVPEGGTQPLPAGLAELLQYAILASEPAPFDPMDQALHALGASHLPPSLRHPNWQLAHEYGLSPDLPAMTHVWADPDQAAASSAATVAIKGGVEGVAGLCPLTPTQAAAVAADARRLAAGGLRVLAVARATHAAPDYPADPTGFAWQFLGLVGFEDPLRPGAAQAVQQCREAGIRVVMITGDHPGTALSIAAQAGIDGAAGVLTGAQVAALDDAALGAQASKVCVYARVSPQQKLGIVQALKAQGAVVAMTGDGVNDAPSLKAAHIGIAMGGRGTDVAREAASLVLLDDDFGAIVQAVRLGRRIYDNLRKAMAFVLAVHVPIAGLSLLPLLLGLPLLFTPVHIAFLELLIDPVCSIVFESEPEEGNVMTRPPRDPAAPLFTRSLILGSLLQGVLVMIVVGGAYVALLRAPWPEERARAAAFTALVACSLALIVVNRSFTGTLWAALRRPNVALWRVVVATSALLGAVLLIPALRTLFHFGALSPIEISGAVGLGVGVMLVLQAARRIRPM
jgi:Ca2+-transporting ATPase